MLNMRLYTQGCRFRASEEAEIIGVDEDQCGEFAYDYAFVYRDLEHNVVSFLLLLLPLYVCVFDDKTDIFIFFHSSTISLLRSRRRLRPPIRRSSHHRNCRLIRDIRHCHHQHQLVRRRRLGTKKV
jgi:hypothetical protein